MAKTEKKLEKKSEKKKSSKKGAAKNSSPLDLTTKRLQKEFNKKMKEVVKEIRKDTERTIKTLMQEAKEKIHAGSEFVMNDVLKSIVTRFEHVSSGEKAAGAEAKLRKRKAPATPAATASRQPVPRGRKVAEASVAKPRRATRTRSKTVTPEISGQVQHTEERAA